MSAAIQEVISEDTPDYWCLECGGDIDTDSDELCSECELDLSVETADLAGDLAAGK